MTGLVFGLFLISDFFHSFKGQWWWGDITTGVFIETPSLGRLPSKAKDPNLAMRHGYHSPYANPVFQYHGGSIIIYLILLLFTHLFIYLFSYIFIILSIHLFCGLDLYKVQPFKSSPHIKFAMFYIVCL